MSKEKKCKLEHPDILELCNVVPKEVINLREFIIGQLNKCTSLVLDLF